MSWTFIRGFPSLSPPPAIFASVLTLTCDFGSVSPAFVVRRDIALTDPSGTYVVLDGNGVAPDFAPYEANPFVHIVDNDVGSIQASTTTLYGTSGNELTYAGQTWTLTHVESGTVISTVPVPVCSPPPPPPPCPCEE